MKTTMLILDPFLTWHHLVDLKYKKFILRKLKSTKIQNFLFPTY